jgi:hypothetical protein
MINSIVPGDTYISVNGGLSSNPYISPGASGAGMMRYNPNMNQIEVNDGLSWITLASTCASIGLTPEAARILDWAKEKMAEEKKLDELCKKYPGMARARENFETIKRLVQSEQTVS